MANDGHIAQLLKGVRAWVQIGSAADGPQLRLIADVAGCEISPLVIDLLGLGLGRDVRP
ncbi:hypothetical protein [Bradyrhizobium sp. DASA03120]|uniref:hypothetical protein n=1 Tax=Bradyrhizobium sp. SMVTL-02 TaxID=3395917 RepID=UPI003F6E676B